LFALPNAGSWPFGITAGPDGNLWFAESDGNRIGHLALPKGVSVPTMTEWGMIIVIILFGIGSVYYLRKPTSAVPTLME
jgi:virginiamycin B lyase